MTDLPRCASCRVQVEPGQNVVFRTDGRVAHVECPEVTCPVCSRKIYPGDPIRRNGDEMLHGNCWVKRYRAMAGGSSASPWTVVFERSSGAHTPEDIEEILAASREVFAEARALRRFTSFVRLGCEDLRLAIARE